MKRSVSDTINTEVEWVIGKLKAETMVMKCLFWGERQSCKENFCIFYYKTVTEWPNMITENNQHGPSEVQRKIVTVQTGIFFFHFGDGLPSQTIFISDTQHMHQPMILNGGRQLKSENRIHSHSLAHWARSLKQTKMLKVSFFSYSKTNRFHTQRRQKSFKWKCTLRSSDFVRYYDDVTRFSRLFLFISTATNWLNGVLSRLCVFVLLFFNYIETISMT